jgi:hypothetical protein
MSMNAAVQLIYANKNVKNQSTYKKIVWLNPV